MEYISSKNTLKVHSYCLHRGGGKKQGEKANESAADRNTALVTKKYLFFFKSKTGTQSLTTTNHTVKFAPLGEVTGVSTP